MAKGKVYYDQPRDCIDWFREQYEFLSNFFSAKTLFKRADQEKPIYGKLLDKFFHGNRDEMTLRILKEQLEGEIAYGIV